MSFRPRDDQSQRAERNRLRFRIGAGVSAALLAVLCICASLGSAYSLWNRVITAAVEAPAALLRQEALSGSLAPRLDPSHVAHLRRSPALSRQRAVAFLPSEAAAQPGQVTGAETTPPTVADAPLAAAAPPEAAGPAESPAPNPAPLMPEPTIPNPPNPTTPTPEPPPGKPTEPPPPPPLPPTTAALPLFEGDQINDFAQVQSAPRALTELPDPLGSSETVFKLTVNDRDVYPVTPTENPRAQALSPSLIEPGDEFWLGTKFMLPENFPSVSGSMSLVSIYGPPFNGSSPWQIEVTGDEFTWTRNSTYGYDVPWRMPLVKGQWISVLLHERFATDGRVEMWIDGQQVTFFPAGSYNPTHQPESNLLTMATMDKSNNGEPNAAKIMQYREAGMFASASLYFGALKIGASRESVEG